MVDNAMTSQSEQLLKEEIHKMLLDNAEEPSDIKNGVGTFTTFRVEYLINDILSKVKEARLETIREFAKEVMWAIGNYEGEGLKTEILILLEVKLAELKK